MKAIVLAAGFATRMFPLTRDRAKPLLDVGGRPVIDWLASRLEALPAVDELIVVTNDRFHADFEAWAATHDGRVPLRVLNDGTRNDSDKLGAIGDLALAVNSIEDRDAPLVVAAGDNLIHFDLAPFAERFEGESERPLLLVREIKGEVPPGRYSEVVLDGVGGVASFREKPADPKSPLFAICLYFLPANVRADLDDYLAQDSNHDAPGYWLQWLSGRRSLGAARLAGEWHDIGNLETLERARIAFARQ
jgi:glucose-1-phosphate thymidylyltransferase